MVCVRDTKALQINNTCAHRGPRTSDCGKRTTGADSTHPSGGPQPGQQSSTGDHGTSPLSRKFRIPRWTGKRAVNSITANPIVNLQNYLRRVISSKSRLVGNPETDPPPRAQTGNLDCSSLAAALVEAPGCTRKAGAPSLRSVQARLPHPVERKGSLAGYARRLVGNGMALSNSAVAALAFLKLHQGFQQPRAAEIRP